MNHHNEAGIVFEVFLCVVIILFLCSLALPRVGSGIARSHETHVLSNMKQLHLVCQQMALDGVTTGDKILGWPGDTGGTFSNWAFQVVKGEYLTTKDLCYLLSGPGVIVPPGKIPQMNDTAVRLYAVDDRSQTNAVLLTSANFTNKPTGGEALNPSAKPFGDRGFVLFRKEGSGSILLPKQVGQTNIIGSFAPMCR